MRERSNSWRWKVFFGVLAVGFHQEVALLGDVGRSKRGGVDHHVPPLDRLEWNSRVVYHPPRPGRGGAKHGQRLGRRAYRLGLQHHQRQGPECHGH